MKVYILIFILLSVQLSINAQLGKLNSIGDQLEPLMKPEVALREKLLSDIKKRVRDHLFIGKDQAINWRTDKFLKLDSLVTRVPDISNGSFERVLIVSHQYTASELLYSSTHLYVRPDGEIAYGGRVLYIYNEFDGVSKYEVQTWNSNDSAWVKYSIVNFEYDVQQHIIQTTEEDWYQGALSGVYRTIFSYNNFDLIVSETGSEWDQDNEVWIDDYKRDFTYTPFKQLKTETYSTKSLATMQWEFKSKTEYAYGQNLLLSTVLSYWSGNTWANSYKTVYTYDSAENLIKILTSNRDEVFPVWIDETRFTNYYDVSNRKISSSWYIWQMDQQLWEERDSTFIRYNEFNDIVDSTRFRWGYTGGGQWYPEQKIEYVFDPTVDFMDILWPVSQVIEEEFTFSKKLSSIITSQYYSPNGTWSPIESVDLFYSELTTGTYNILNEPLAVFPNPASGFIVLRSDVVVDSYFEIYSLYGVKVKEMTIPADRHVSLSNLVPGTYYYLIRNTSEIITGKFIIQ